MSNWICSLFGHKYVPEEEYKLQISGDVGLTANFLKCSRCGRVQRNIVAVGTIDRDTFRTIFSRSAGGPVVTTEAEQAAETIIGTTAAASPLARTLDKWSGEVAEETADVVKEARGRSRRRRGGRSEREQAAQPA